MMYIVPKLLLYLSLLHLLNIHERDLHCMVDNLLKMTQFLIYMQAAMHSIKKFIMCMQEQDSIST